jgi:hypothetical protein
MRRIKKRLYYFIETLFVRSTAYQVIGVALALGVLAAAGGTIVHLATPKFEDYPRAIWWAFLRLTDTGYLGDDEGTVARAVSTVLTISGAVLFLGAMIAIMTNWLNRFMSNLASGLSQIFEEEHILILGWHPRLHGIIEEIVRAKERVKLRLGRVRLPAIAVLVEDFEPGMLAELEQKLEPDVRDNVRLLMRSGNPLEAESLERVDYMRASSIILLSDPEQANQRHFADITLVKTLLSMKAHSPGDISDDELPNVVIEINDPANKKLAESAGWRHHTEAVASEEFTSRLFNQTMRHPGISEVYSHLLTDTYGESLFLRRVDQLHLEGETLRSVIHKFRDAIPIGFLKARESKYSYEGRLRILELDEPMDADDEVICVSPSIRAISDGLELQRDQPEGHVAPEGLDAVSDLSDPPASYKVMIVGWSHLVRPLLVEMGLYALDSYEVLIVSERSEADVMSDVQGLVEKYGNLTIDAHESSLSRADEIRAVQPERFDRIVLLSPSFIDDPLVADAETVMASVLLQRDLREHGRDEGVPMVIELNDEDNQPLLQLYEVRDIIVTQEIISHLLSQVAVRRALAWIYEELFTYGGTDVQIRPFGDIFEGDELEDLTFDDVQTRCLRKGLVCVGYMLAEARGAFSAGTHLNPSRVDAITPADSDKIVVFEGE